MNSTRRILRLPSVLLLVLGAVTLAIAGCASALPNPMVMTQPAPLAMVVRLCDSAAAGCDNTTSFSLGAMRDLAVNVDWQNVPGGTHTQQLTVMLPNGVIYQTISHGFGVAEGTAGSPTVSDAMPVAGTFLTQRQLTGDWTVQVSLDGAVIGAQI